MFEKNVLRYIFRHQTYKNTVYAGIPARNLSIQ